MIWKVPEGLRSRVSSTRVHNDHTLMVTVCQRRSTVSARLSFLLSVNAVTRSSCPAGIEQIFGAPAVGLAAPPHMPVRICSVCVRSKELPILGRVEDVTAAENRMDDELSAVSQGIDPALS